MKRKLILHLTILCLFCFGATVLAEGERPLLGVHWSYTPMLGFVEDSPGTLWSAEHGIVISVVEYPKSGLTLETSANNWLSTNQGVAMKRTVYWIHHEMKAIVLEASYAEKGYEFMVYFIETPDSITEITVAGKDNFLELQQDLQEFIKTFSWQEKLSMDGLPYRMELPEGWGLARMAPSTDYFTPGGKDPAVEEMPYLFIYYIKESAVDGELQQRLAHANMPDYSKYNVIEQDDLKIGEWPARIWVITVTKEDQSTINVLACRIATDRFIYNLETLETSMSKATFKKMVSTWRFVGNDSVRYFNE